MKLKRDQITGLLTMILGVLVFISISGYKVKFTPSYPGPQALPGLAAIGFIICGAGVFINGCRQNEEKPFLTKEGWIRLLISMGMLVLYVAGMQFIGFFISTPIFLYACCTFYAKGYNTKPVTRIIFSLGVTLIVFLCYQVAFGYILPTGILFG